MDQYGCFDLLGEEFEFLTVPNYWVFKDHTYSKPLEAEIDTKNAKVAGIEAESREYNFFAEEVNEEILNDFIENDLMEETSNESKIKIECEIKCERLEDKRYSKLDETELNAFADANTEKSTKVQTKWSVGIFRGKIAALKSCSKI